MEKRYLNDTGLVHFWDKVKSHVKDSSDNLQSQIDDKQKQITANDGDIEKLQTRSTQMEASIKDIAVSGGASVASAVSFEDTETQLDAVNVQVAIEKLDKNAIILGEDIDKLRQLQLLAKYKKCKVSLIGDSISTYKGYIPSDYLHYYPQGSVNNVSKTYWYKVCSELDANIQNLSYSGSTVTNQNYANYDFYKRSKLVDSDASLIIVALGVNDTEKETNVGEINYTKEIDSYDESIFTEAYIKGVRTLIQEHPTSEILLMVIAPSNSMPNRADTIQTIAQHYGLMYYDARGTYSGSLHPDTDTGDDGSEMENIANGLIKVLSTNVYEGYNIKSSDCFNSIIRYDVSKNGNIVYASLQDAINAVPKAMQRYGVKVLAKIQGNWYYNEYELKTHNVWSSDAKDWKVSININSYKNPKLSLISKGSGAALVIDTVKKTISSNSLAILADANNIIYEDYNTNPYTTSFVTDYDVKNRLGILFYEYSTKKIYWYDYLKEIPMMDDKGNMLGVCIGTIMYTNEECCTIGFNFTHIIINGKDYYGNLSLSPSDIERFNKSSYHFNNGFIYPLEVYKYNYLIEETANRTWVSSSAIASFNAIIPEGVKLIKINKVGNANVYFLKDLNYKVSSPNFINDGEPINVKEETILAVPDEAKYISVSTDASNDIKLATNVSFNETRHLVGGTFSYSFSHKKIYFVTYKTYEDYKGNGFYIFDNENNIIDENIRNVRASSINISSSGYRFSFKPSKDAVGLRITGANPMNEIEIVEDKGTPYYIVDGDISGDVDDLIALRVMAQAEKEGRLIIAGINCSYNDTNSVQGVDGFMCHEGLYDVPIGLEKTTEPKANSIYLPICAKYPHGYKSNDEVDDSLEFYRKILKWLPYNHKNILLTLGGMTSLERVLKDDECYALLSEKIYRIYVMGSNLPTSYGETNFWLYGIDNVNYVLANTPVPIYIVPFAIGGNVLGGASMGKAGMSFDLLQRSLAAYRYKSPTEEVTRECPDPLAAICAIADDEQSLGLYKRRMSKLTINSDKSITPTYKDTIGMLYHLQINTNEYLTEDLYNQQKQYMLNSILLKKDGIYNSNVIRMSRN